MPWCDPCDRFYNPNTLLIDGSCPRCSTVLTAEHDHDHEGHQSGAKEAEQAKIPWHFWLVLVLVALYLGWRVIEGVRWVFEAIF